MPLSIEHDEDEKLRGVSTVSCHQDFEISKVLTSHELNDS
jgi:hypothetical protein